MVGVFCPSECNCLTCTVNLQRHSNRSAVNYFIYRQRNVGGASAQSTKPDTNIPSLKKIIFREQIFLKYCIDLNDFTPIRFVPRVSLSPHGHQQ